MAHSGKAASTMDEVTKRDLRGSGIPAPGKLGDAKKEVWWLAIGIGVLVLIFIATFIDTAL
jgi:hypothetical protein